MKVWARRVSLLGVLFLGACQSATVPDTGLENTFEPKFSREKVANASLITKPEASKILNHIWAERENLGLCEFSFNAEQAKQWSKVYPVAENEYLAQVLCFNGAYQGSFEFARVDASNDTIAVEPLSFTLAGFPSYDPETQILSNGYKFRGIGDCLELTEHRWVGNDLMLLTSKLHEELEGSCKIFQGGESYVIQADQVGYAKIGMTLGELKGLMGKDASFEESMLGAIEGKGIEVSQYGEVLYQIGFEDKFGLYDEAQFSDSDKIALIQVSNRTFKTQDGIGPGTPLKDAIAAYGKATLGINVEDESREYITFEQGLSDDVLFRSNQWALDGEAGVYEGEAKLEPYRSTTLFKSQAAIGSITILPPRN